MDTTNCHIHVDLAPEFYVIEHVDESGTHYYLEFVGEHSERWVKAPVFWSRTMLDGVLRFHTPGEADRFLRAHNVCERPVCIIPIMNDQFCCSEGEG